MAAHPLESRPEVDLQRFEQIAKMDVPIGVGECSGSEDFSFLFAHEGASSPLLIKEVIY
jgi:hypothetical protein